MVSILPVLNSLCNVLFSKIYWGRLIVNVVDMFYKPLLTTRFMMFTTIYLYSWLSLYYYCTVYLLIKCWYTEDETKFCISSYYFVKNSKISINVAKSNDYDCNSPCTNQCAYLLIPLCVNFLHFHCNSA